jgi:uncharacterized membrane protein YccC
MKDFILQMYERHPAFTALGGLIFASIATAIVGHIIYLLGLAVTALAVVVGITFVVGAKYGNKSRNDKDSDPSSGHRP